MFFFWGESSLFLFYPVVVQGCWVIAEQGRCLWHCRQAWVKLEDELVKLNQFLSCYIRQIAATRFIQFEIKSCFIFFSWISSDDACVVEIQDTAFLRGKLYSIIILPSFQFFSRWYVRNCPALDAKWMWKFELHKPSWERMAQDKMYSICLWRS